MRLIDAEKLIHELSKSKVLMIVNDESNYNYMRQSDVFKIVDSIPTIEERKKGKWRVYEGEMTCSCCETTFYTDMCEYIDGNVPKFCPNCGADMREEENK